MLLGSGGWYSLQESNQTFYQSDKTEIRPTRKDFLFSIYCQMRCLDRGKLFLSNIKRLTTIYITEFLPGKSGGLDIVQTNLEQKII